MGTFSFAKESRQNHSAKVFTSAQVAIAKAVHVDEDDLSKSHEQSDLSENKVSFGSRRKLLVGTAVVGALGVCAFAYLFLTSPSEKTLPQTAELFPALQPLPATVGHAAPSTSESSPAASDTAARQDSFSLTTVQPDEALKAALAALPTMTESRQSVPARNQEILSLQRPGVKIRSTPSKTAIALGTPRKGTEFKVTSREGDWVQVENGRLKGWIKAQFLAPTEPR